MDLFLMDIILKGKVPSEGRVWDIGCGAGRNGIYFLKQGYEYHGWDTDSSQIRLLEYFAQSLKNSNGHFQVNDLRSAAPPHEFDLIICSRVLHFASSIEDFMCMWKNLSTSLAKQGVLYISMDSIVNTTLGEELSNGKYTFPDGKVRFALTESIYEEIKKGFEEIEPLRTLVYHKTRAQSFFAFRKL